MKRRGVILCGKSSWKYATRGHVRLRYRSSVTRLITRWHHRGLNVCLFVWFLFVCVFRCLFAIYSQTQNVQLDSSLGARSVTTSVQRPHCHVTMPEADALILILAWLRLRHQKKTQSFDHWRSLRTRRTTTGLGWSSEIILYVGWMVHPWT